MATVPTLRRAEKILGYGIQAAASSVRSYTVIDDVLYTDLFTGAPTIEGYTGTIKTRFNGVQGTPYFNEIHLDKRQCKRQLDVTAVWGNASFLTEIDELLTWLEDNPFSDTVEEAGIRSKKIEDFSVTAKDSKETATSVYDAIISSWGFYIRNPIIISVTPEQKHDYRYF